MVETSAVEPSILKLCIDLTKPDVISSVLFFNVFFHSVLGPLLNSPWLLFTWSLFAIDRNSDVS